VSFRAPKHPLTLPGVVTGDCCAAKMLGGMFGVSTFGLAWKQLQSKPSKPLQRGLSVLRLDSTVLLLQRGVHRSHGWWCAVEWL